MDYIDRGPIWREGGQLLYNEGGRDYTVSSCRWIMEYKGRGPMGREGGELLFSQGGRDYTAVYWIIYRFEITSQEFLGENLRRISQEFLETETQNCDPQKICHLGDQFWGISSLLLLGKYY